MVIGIIGKTHGVRMPNSPPNANKKKSHNDISAFSVFVVSVVVSVFSTRELLMSISRFVLE